MISFCFFKGSLCSFPSSLCSCPPSLCFYFTTIGLLLPFLIKFYSGLAWLSSAPHSRPRENQFICDSLGTSVLSPSHGLSWLNLVPHRGYYRLGSSFLAHPDSLCSAFLFDGSSRLVLLFESRNSGNWWVVDRHPLTWLSSFKSPPTIVQSLWSERQPHNLGFDSDPASYVCSLEGVLCRS